jgi:type IV pilus assembly protein PilV
VVHHAELFVKEGGCMKKPDAAMRGIRQRGFSLIEVLIALMVLSVGLMALAAMQEFAITRSLDANELSIATNLATEMIERIKTDAHAYKTASTLISAYNNITVAASGTVCPGSPIMAAGNCNQWRTRMLATRLPTPVGTVLVAGTGPGNLNQVLVTVRISWKGLIVPMTFSTVITI